jgi:small nuclear ribonucleoprotein (snRNP)-like protein
MMKEFLAKMIGRRVDVFCGGASSLRGEIVKVEEVLHLKDNDGKLCYVAIDKIVVVWDARDGEHRAGFVPAS